jgi:hypothetical protein
MESGGAGHERENPKALEVRKEITMKHAARCALFVVFVILLVQAVLSLLDTQPVSPATEPRHDEPIIEQPVSPVIDVSPLPSIENQTPASPPLPPPPQSQQAAIGFECEGGTCRPVFRLFRGLLRR